MADPISAAIVASFALSGAAAVAVQAVVSIGISFALSQLSGALLSKDRGTSSGGGGFGGAPDPGVKQRLPGNPNNKFPAIYGEQRVKGITFFADISSDKKTLALLLGLSEGPIEEIGDVRWDDFTLSLDDDGSVTGAVNSQGVEDDWLNGNIQIVSFPEGGACTQMEDFSERWADNKENRLMPNLAYIFIKVTYDREESITGITQNLTFDIKGRKMNRFDGTDGDFEMETVTIDGEDVTRRVVEYSTNPAECLYDYMTNSLYGGGGIIFDDSLDLASFASHASFCDAQINHNQADGTSVTANRYESHGFVNTKDNVDLVISDFLGCSQGILNYSQGKFVLITDTVGDSVMSFDDSNLYGDVIVAEQGFELRSNELTVAYESKEKYYQGDQVFLEIPASRKHANEPELSSSIQYSFINNNVMAERLGTILLNKSRNSQIVTIRTDSRALELQPTDVIDVTRPNAGIDGKEYKINSISETTIGDGSLSGFEIVAQEYTPDDYEDLTLTEEDVAENTAFADPRDIGTVGEITFSSNTPRSISPSITISFLVPSGIIDAFEVYIGEGTDEDDRFLTQTEESPSGGFTPGASTSIVVRVPDDYDNLVFWIKPTNQYYSGAAYSNPEEFGEWAPEVPVVSDIQSIGTILEDETGELYGVEFRYAYTTYSNNADGSDFKDWDDFSDAEKNADVYQGWASSNDGTRVFSSTSDDDVAEFTWIQRDGLTSDTDPYYRHVGGRIFSLRFVDSTEAVEFIFSDYSIDDGEVIDTDFITTADITAKVDIELSTTALSVSNGELTATATLNVNDTPIVATSFYDDKEIAYRAEGFIRGALTPVAEVTTITFSGVAGLTSESFGDEVEISLPNEDPASVTVEIASGDSSVTVAGRVASAIDAHPRYAVESTGSEITITGEPSGARTDITVSVTTISGSTLAASLAIDTQGESVNENRTGTINGRVLPSKDIILTAFITGGNLGQLQVQSDITFTNDASPDFGNGDTDMNTSIQNDYEDEDTLFDYNSGGFESIDFNAAPIE